MELLGPKAHGEVVRGDASGDADGDGRAVVTAGDGQLGGAGEERRDEDVVGEQIAPVGGAEGVACAGDVPGRGAVPVHQLVLGDGRRGGAGLVRGNVGLCDDSPAVMGEAVGPLGGAVVSVMRLGGGDVVGLAVVWVVSGFGFSVEALPKGEKGVGAGVLWYGNHVGGEERTKRTVPGDEFNQRRLNLEHLVPSVGDELLADKDPVLGVKVRREPGRHGCVSFF